MNSSSKNAYLLKSKTRENCFFCTSKVFNTNTKVYRIGKLKARNEKFNNINKPPTSLLKMPSLHLFFQKSNEYSSSSMKKPKELLSINTILDFEKAQHSEGTFSIENKKAVQNLSQKENINKQLVQNEEKNVTKKNEKLKKNYTSYSKLSEIKLVTIGIASPLRILQWAEKTLPNGKIYGEVLNANTLHHKTYKPQKGGLFCERIFGPLKDFECACGKVDKSVKKIQTDLKFSFSKSKNVQPLLLNQNQTKSSSDVINTDPDSNIKISRKFCPDCDVEYTWSVIRRYQLGYIKLSSPITHIWFLKGTPSYLSLLLDMKKRYLQFVTYCSETLTIEKSCLPFYTSNVLEENIKNIKGTTILELNNSNYDNKSESTIANNINSLNTQEFNVNINENVLKLEKNNKNKQVTKTKRVPCVSKPEWRLNLLSKKNLNLDENKSAIEKNKKGVFALSTLLLSIYYKYPSNMLFKNRILTNKDFSLISTSSFLSTNEVPKLKTLFKKLPLDLYILCILENNLHKNAISLSIEKTWEILYKRAFFKAIKKSQKIFNKFLKLNRDKKPLNKNMNSSLIPSNTFTKEEQQYSGSGFGSSQQIENIYKSNIDLVNKIEKSELIMKKIKKKYHNHVLKSFETLRYPILSVNNTTVFLQKNSFFDIQNKISREITKYLLNNTEDIENVLSEFLLNSVLLDKFINISCKSSSSSSSFSSSSSSSTTKLLNNETLLVTPQTNNIEINKKINDNTEKKSLVKNSVSYGRILNILKIRYKLNLFINSEEYQENLKQKADVIPLYGGMSVIKMSLLPKDGSKRNPLKSINNLFDFAQFNITKDTKISKKKMYNNIYTLSHRERWETDKDWYIFSLFSFGITDNYDYPIPTYKDRLVLLTTLKNNNNNIPETENTIIEKEKLFGSSLHETPIYEVQMQQDKFKKPKVDEFLVFESVKNATILTKQRSKMSIMNALSHSQLIDSKKPSPNLLELDNKNTTILSESTDLVSGNFKNYSSFYSGAGIIQQLLNEFDLNEIQKLDKQNRLVLYQLNKYILKFKKLVEIYVYDKNAQVKVKELCKKRDLLIRRIKLVRKILQKNTNPASMILTVIPVLPPDLRPIVKMGNQIAASDLNRLYQRVIYRNDRLKKFLKDPATSQSYEMKYAQRLLQEAVDNLLQNSKGGLNAEKDARGRVLKSLSEILKGKQGRFRQFLLGKRVDYSGRSVIVVGPKLKLHECGLPVEMAKELYLPFLLKSILNKRYAKTVFGAKTLIKKNPSLANELLREIMHKTPVLLNRAPTLHRLGFQAFVPKLIEGRAILLHPLVCSAFNADFDGDQMAVHVPITVEARAEAWKILLSRNNLLSPATGEPLAIPSQDMVLGCYYLTTFSQKSKILNGSGLYFNHLFDVIKLYEQKLINVHAFIWVKWNKHIQNGKDKESPLELRISPFGQWQEITTNYHKTYNTNNQLINIYMCTTPGRILFNLIIQSCL